MVEILIKENGKRGVRLDFLESTYMNLLENGIFSRNCLLVLVIFLVVSGVEEVRLLNAMQ